MMNEIHPLSLPHGRTAALHWRVVNLRWVWWAHPTAVALDGQTSQAIPDPTRRAQVGLWLMAAAVVMLYWLTHSFLTPILTPNEEPHDN